MNKISGSLQDVVLVDELAKCIRLMVLKSLAGVPKKTTLTLGIENMSAKIISREMTCESIRRECSKLMSIYLAKQLEARFNISKCIRDQYFVTINST